MQLSNSKPLIDVLASNHGGDVVIVGHNAGRWDHGTGVILDNVIDAHCFGAHNFSTNQIGTAGRRHDGRIVLNWKDGPDSTSPASDPTSSPSQPKSHPDTYHPMHWAPWVKQ